MEQQQQKRWYEPQGSIEERVNERAEASPEQRLYIEQQERNHDELAGDFNRYSAVNQHYVDQLEKGFGERVEQIGAGVKRESEQFSQQFGELDTSNMSDDEARRAAMQQQQQMQDHRDHLEKIAEMRIQEEWAGVSRESQEIMRGSISGRDTTSFENYVDQQAERGEYQAREFKQYRDAGSAQQQQDNYQSRVANQEQSRGAARAR